MVLVVVFAYTNPSSLYRRTRATSTLSGQPFAMFVVLTFTLISFGKLDVFVGPIYWFEFSGKGPTSTASRS